MDISMDIHIHGKPGDVVSVETSRSRFDLGAICLGLDPVGLVSGLGPLRLVETFCAGALCIL